MEADSLAALCVRFTLALEDRQRLVADRLEIARRAREWANDARFGCRLDCKLTDVDLHLAVAPADI